MNVCVRNFHSQHCHADTLARNRLLDSLGHTLGERYQTVVCLIIKVEDVVVLCVLRYDQSVAFLERRNVEECVVVLVLSYLVAWNLAFCDFCENCSHILFIPL